MKQYLIAAAASLAVCAFSAQAVDEPAKKIWEHSVALGFTLTKGNSDTLLGTANWLSQAKWDKNELRVGADGAYGENDGKRNTQSAHGFAQYNRLFSERFFGYLRADGYHDGIADIDYRVVLSPGAGYYFIKNQKTQLSGEVGPGWVFEKKGGVTDDYFTIRFAERFEHKFNDRVRVWQSVEYLPQVEQWSDYIINAEVGVETMMSKMLSLRAYLQDSYVSKPAAGRDRNDLKLVTAIAFKF
jgi:putative salt-induced outer membrane protein